MKITLVEETTYTIKTEGGQLSDFKVVDTWEGFMKLQNSSEEVAIVSTRTQGLGQELARIFAPVESRESEVVLLSASPSIVFKLGV